MRPLIPCMTLMLCAASALAAREVPADLVFEGDAIWTGTATVEAIAVRGDKIVYVGPRAGAEALIGPATRVRDVTGKLVMPAFHDAHVHPVIGGMGLLKCDLTDIPTRAEVLKTIRTYAAAHASDAWVTGGGWALPLYPDGNPHRTELDSVVADRPAYLQAQDGHSAWANTKALELAHVTRETPDPPLGKIERDADGTPSGTLRESAMGLVDAFVPAATDAERLAGLKTALALAARLGICALTEAAADQDTLKAYRTLEAHGELTARISISYQLDPAKGSAQVADLVHLQRKLYGPHLRLAGAKLFADGVIESRTAGLIEPYLGTHDTGILNWKPDEMRRTIDQLDRTGMQVHVHAIGDGAVRETLDAIEAARRARPDQDCRHQIAHLELIAPSDLARFHALHVVADFQPLWAQADPWVTQLTVPLIGQERASRLYPIHSTLHAGAVVVAGSDWPVTSLNPLEAIQTAITRAGVDKLARTRAPLNPHEAVTLPEVLAMYTSTAAWLNHWEAVTGTLEVGKSADVIVVDRNLFALPPAQIHEARVLLTVFEGHTIYEKGVTAEPAVGRR